MLDVVKSHEAILLTTSFHSVTMHGDGMKWSGESPRVLFIIPIIANTTENIIAIIHDIVLKATSESLLL